MRLNNVINEIWQVRIIFTLGLYGFSLLIYSAQAASTATVTVTATFVAATCDIKIPAIYWLGTLTPGAIKKHSPLKIKWSCDSDQLFNSALKASLVTGVSNHSKEKLEMMVDGYKNGTLLWLEDSHGQTIKLSGNDDDVFCASNGSGVHDCDLTPITEVHPTDKFGIATAVIHFEVVYQ
ncbi:fimbrial protein [Edwardsiella tarda]|uniref:fimbrial protein n=1 Tax=Edwardsiella tarda TaxID=636 RepID=UPI00351C79E4